MSVDRPQPQKRLFLGWECELARARPFPLGREISPHHITLVFLGNVEADMSKLQGMPQYKGAISPCCIGSAVEFLPEKTPRVAALKLEGLPEEFFSYQKEASDWFLKEGFPIDKRLYHPHVSLVRAPFEPIEWSEWFYQQPVLLTSIHLYESLGNSHYRPLLTQSLLTPFEEIEHTADVAFVVRGRNVEELFLHAQMAIAFHFPEFLRYVQAESLKDLASIIRKLNELISLMDKEIGSPLKAVSYHGDIEKEKNGLLEWKMIIDV